MKKHYLTLLLFCLVVVSCQTGTVNRDPSNTGFAFTSDQTSWQNQNNQQNSYQQYLRLPILQQHQLTPQVVKRYKMTSETAKVVSNYFSFLGIDPQSKEGVNLLQRLGNSSVQFLFCNNPNDWECLEKTPPITARSKHRIEVSHDLGKRIFLDRPFSAQVLFTKQWAADKEEKDLSTTMSQKLATFMKAQKWDSISIATYGMDDLTDSMKSMVEEIYQQQKSGAKVQAVFDIKNKKGVEILYPYQGNPEIVSKMNSLQPGSARFENPITKDIMHNKFIVFNKDNRSFVWTGTTNFSKTCMGYEENANMTILIDDNDIAQTFKVEFDEMYGTSSVAGKFHKNKKPNTYRFFQFNDGHEVKIHFSPTDDGEHRSILPFIYSAGKGDELRIAMFGSGGLELVRALQFAAARGVKIRISLDRMTGLLPGSWVNQDSKPNLFEANPYQSGAEKNIEVRISTWSGMNHLKSATLTRMLSNGAQRVEAMIVGSQNWSASGNDDNDENMITLRNLKNQDLEYGLKFNQYFEALWLKSEQLK